MEEKKEEIIIENKYKVTKDLYKKWTKENKRVKFFKWFWLIFSIYCLGMAILFICTNQANQSIPYFVFIVYALGVRALVRYLGVERRYKLLSKFYKTSDWERRIMFLDDHFEINDEGINKLTLQYSDLLDYEKNDECLKVRMNNGYIRLYKDSFVKSSFEECERFLNSKGINEFVKKNKSNK